MPIVEESIIVNKILVITTHVLVKLNLLVSRDKQLVIIYCRHDKRLLFPLGFISSIHLIKENIHYVV